MYRHFLIAGILSVLWTTAGCVVGPGLSLHVNDYMRTIQPGGSSKDPLAAQIGSALVYDGPLMEIDSLVLERPFEGQIPGTLGVNFSFRIDACQMVLSYRDETWLYYVAKKGCASAWYNHTSVFSEEDHAGVRVRRSSPADREWFVDNSLYNNLPGHGYARWHRKVVAKDGVTLSTRPAIISRVGIPVRWIRYDGTSPGSWNFTFVESNGQDRSEKSIRIDARAGAVVEADGARIRVVAGTAERIEFVVENDFDGAESPGDPSQQEGEAVGARSGTCFAVSPTGLILTAHHVIANASTVTVQFSGKGRQPAEVVQASTASDLAVLKVAAATNDFLPIAPQRSARLGQKVFTVGYPAIDVLGAEPKYSEGTISALSGIQGEASFLQISVPIQPGNSGGALVDESGRVIGIVTSTAAISGFMKATGALPQNVSWAVKSEMAMALFDQPGVRSLKMSRDQVIDKATKATCFILAE